MKPIIIVVFFCIMSHLPIMAQFSVAVGGGLNFSNVSIEAYDTETSVANNYFLSARPILRFNKNFGVSVDVQLSQKGYVYQLLDSSQITEHKLQYLDLIPQVHYQVLEALGIYGGIGVGIKIKEQDKVNDVWTSSVTGFSKNTNLAYVLGLRIYPIKKLSINAQYGGSLTSIKDIDFTNSQGTSIGIGKFNLNNFQVGLSYEIF